jgi:hypothetical protein
LKKLEYALGNAQRIKTLRIDAPTRKIFSAKKVFPTALDLARKSAVKITHAERQGSGAVVALQSSPPARRSFIGGRFRLRRAADIDKALTFIHRALTGL